MEEKYTQKSVLNYSSMILNENHISLLSKGLKFCPTPGNPNNGELREDLDKLHRRMRWTAFYENPEDFPLSPTAPDPLPINNLSSEPFTHPRFRLKSKSKGPIGPTNLEAFISANEKDFLNRSPYIRKHRYNLNRGELTVLNELKSNNNIIIRSADKGSAVVILNREDYLKEGFRQLSDNVFYQH